MTAYARSVDMDRVISEVKPASTRAGRTGPIGAAAGWRVVGEDGQSTTCARTRDTVKEPGAGAPKSPPARRSQATAASLATAAQPSAAMAAKPAAEPPTSAAAETPPAAAEVIVTAQATAPKAAAPKRKAVDLDSLLGRAPTRRAPRPKAPEPPDPLARLMSGEGLSHAKVDTQLTRLIDAWPMLPQSVREEMIRLMESAAHGQCPGASGTPGSRTGRSSGSPGWRRFFHVLAGS